MGALVSLVGGNPMAPLIAAAVRRPDQLVLLASTETAATARRVKSALRSATERTNVRVVEVEDSCSAPEVAAALERLEPGWDLDYTGGTKVMAAHARLVFERCGSGRPDGASYTDASSQVVRFDDGTLLPLREVSVSLDAIARVHGTPIVSSSHHDVRPTPEEIVALAKRLLEVMGDREHVSVGREVERILGRKANAPRWVTLAKAGDWLEIFVADAASRWLVNRELPGECLQGVNIRLGRRPAELDVVVRAGVRVGVVSCTVGAANDAVPKAKAKLLEVAERRRQLAGSQTRFALATLLPPRGVELLEGDVSRGYDTGPSPVVWGAREMAQIVDGDLSVFDRWL